MHKTRPAQVWTSLHGMDRHWLKALPQHRAVLLQQYPITATHSGRPSCSFPRRLPEIATPETLPPYSAVKAKALQGTIQRPPYLIVTI